MTMTDVIVFSLIFGVTSAITGRVIDAVVATRRKP